MTSDVEVLVVGAGPTGLALAAQLVAHGVRPRLIDRGRDRVHESRALAVQPRSLEVLAGLGVTEEMVARGNPTVQLCIHAPRRAVAVPLFNLGLDDTAYPFLLFLSQAETERILEAHVDAAGIAVERGVELVDLHEDPNGEQVVCWLRHGNGHTERVTASYVAGCDGARSAVRRAAGIPFGGGSYPQTFVLADLEADGIDPGAAHTFLSRLGILFFFPLGHPASWRLLAMRPRTAPARAAEKVTSGEVQAIADAYTGGTVRLHDPVWMTNFRLQHRAARRYRWGRVFLAGDAAHVHSPAGGQGMNTGIQDAINLGWKLAHVTRGVARAEILETYHTERAPVGRSVVRFTDRAFTIGTSTNPLIGFARARVVPAIIPIASRARTGRAYAFRKVAQLDVRYRASPLSENDPRSTSRGPRAGDRLPDATIVDHGRPTTLHRAIGGPGWHLLLCGPGQPWQAATMPGPGLPALHRLTRLPEAGALLDETGGAMGRLGIDPDEPAHLLIRPDGHIGYRAGGGDLRGVASYLARWSTDTAPSPGVTD